MSEHGTHIEMLDPTAEIGVAGLRPAPRLRDVRGARIGALDNGKWNADRILDEVLRGLVDRHGATAGAHLSKPRYNLVVEPGLADELAQTSSAMVVAIGD